MLWSLCNLYANDKQKCKKMYMATFSGKDDNLGTAVGASRWKKG